MKYLPFLPFFTSKVVHLHERNETLFAVRLLCNPQYSADSKVLYFVLTIQVQLYFQDVLVEWILNGDLKSTYLWCHEFLTSPYNSYDVIPPHHYCHNRLECWRNLFPFIQSYLCLIVHYEQRSGIWVIRTLSFQHYHLEISVIFHHFKVIR